MYLLSVTQLQQILPVIHLTMAEADLSHPVLKKDLFYEARLIQGTDDYVLTHHPLLPAGTFYLE